MNETDGDALFRMPYLVMLAAAVVMAASAILVVIAKYFDITKGPLTISLIIVAAFITATFASMVYNIQQTPLTEILVGGLATALGAIVAFWMRRADENK